MTTTKMCADGIERKMTIAEFFAQEGLAPCVEIVSAKQGEWVSGSPRYCMEHLDHKYYGACVQGADLSGDRLTVHVR